MPDHDPAHLEHPTQGQFGAPLEGVDDSVPHRLKMEPEFDEAKMQTVQTPFVDRVLRVRVFRFPPALCGWLVGWLWLLILCLLSYVCGTSPCYAMYQKAGVVPDHHHIPVHLGEAQVGAAEGVVGEPAAAPAPEAAAGTDTAATTQHQPAVVSAPAAVTVDMDKPAGSQGAETVQPLALEGSEADAPHPHTQ